VYIACINRRPINLVGTCKQYPEVKLDLKILIWYEVAGVVIRNGV
jgi:hypothetical protein